MNLTNPNGGTNHGEKGKEEKKNPTLLDGSEARVVEKARRSSSGLSAHQARNSGRVRASSSSGTLYPRSRSISSAVRRARKRRWLSTLPPRSIIDEMQADTSGTPSSSSPMAAAGSALAAVRSAESMVSADCWEGRIWFISRVGWVGWGSGQRDKRELDGLMGN